MLKKLFITKVATMLFTLCISGISIAQQQTWCSGKIKSFLVSADGVLMINPDWHADFLALCSLRVNHNNIDPAACRGMLSTVTTATAGKFGTTIHFPSITSCGSVATYLATPPISYVMLSNP